MSVQLQQWFSLEIMHEYFHEQKCTVFALVPFFRTKQLMKNYGIHLRQIENTYTGYVGVKNTNKIWEELSADEDLYFQMICIDTNFNNYTNTSSTLKEDTLLYISNFEVANRLHAEESINPEKYLPVQPLRFNVSVSVDRQVTVDIKDSKGNKIYSKNSIIGQSNVYIDIEVFGSGMYQIWVENQLLSTFLGISERIDDNCYGIFHIRMKTILESLKENTIPAMQVNFRSRETFWQYLVVIPKDRKIMIRELAIEGVDQTSYMGPEEKEIVGGEKSKVFTSPKTIKLQQKIRDHPLLKMKYSNSFSDTILELDMKMPLPNVSKIVSTKENNENIYYSPTIIYV
ncbi:hypothetical protein [Aquimarina litoralis]|uniref:hypothetical protein n=1 Tax=Aquimarina litoralis TaxID=584605 RepID=UPI001C5A008F|nr:hypothetical protein [Aquimarina litoralis]MBW1296046.1 hypothetical protein [Aquimarina litoralis]